jgi:hypothetical protein
MLLKFGILDEELLVKVLPIGVSKRKAEHETGHRQRNYLYTVALVDDGNPVLLHCHVPPEQRVEVQPAEIRMRLDVAAAPRPRPQAALVSFAARHVKEMESDE